MAYGNLALNNNWQSQRPTYKVLTPKQLEAFNNKYGKILTGRQYMIALYNYESKHGYRIEEPQIN